MQKLTIIDEQKNINLIIKSTKNRRIIENKKKKEKT